jgi:hypothetical protein
MWAFGLVLHHTAWVIVYVLIAFIVFWGHYCFEQITHGVLWRWVVGKWRQIVRIVTSGAGGSGSGKDHT